MKKILTRVGSFIKSSFGAIILTISAITIVWHVVIWWQGIAISANTHIVLFLADILIGWVLLDCLTYFFAQFVLPIQNQSDRKEIYKRVKDFASNNSGPAIFIKNGYVIEHEGERDRKKPGVVVLDTASAAVIQTDIEYVEAVGPGIRFTKVNKIDGEEFIEYLAGSVDLRTQWKFVGPMANEQPFINPPTYPDPVQYNKMQKRRQETSGWTRDGFEVSPTIGIKFRVMRKNNIQSKSGVTTHYGYDPENVWKAIVHKSLKLEKDKDSQDLMKWDELPAHLATNLWREYIRKFKLEELFTSTDEVSKLQTIEDMMNSRVQREQVVPLNDIGEPILGHLVKSPEFEHLIERGIEILEIRIRNILFEPDLEKKIAEQWSGEWLKTERKKEELLKKREASSEAIIRKKASRKFANLSSSLFDNTGCQQDIFSTLQDLIEPLKDTIAIEGRENPELKDVNKTLETVWKWLLTSKNQPSK